MTISSVKPLLSRNCCKNVLCDMTVNVRNFHSMYLYKRIHFSKVLTYGPKSSFDIPIWLMSMVWYHECFLPLYQAMVLLLILSFTRIVSFQHQIYSWLSDHQIKCLDWTEVKWNQCWVKLRFSLFTKYSQHKNLEKEK